MMSGDGLSDKTPRGLFRFHHHYTSRRAGISLLNGRAAIGVSGVRRGLASAVIEDQAGNYKDEQNAGNEAADAEFESRF